MSDLPRTEDEKIIEEARKRFKRCEEHESIARKRYIEDVKFCNGDSDNRWQWPEDIRNNRDLEGQPTLTINKTRQHCLQIINDGRQNKSSIKVSPSTDEATYEAAQVYEGICRHIEYISNAQAAYTHASRCQVQGGIGYIRIVTDYVDEDSFDQEIFIRRVKDPLSVYIDPDINDPDGSDARFAFVFDDVPRDEAEFQYPELKNMGSNDTLGNSKDWVNKDHIRVAEYYRRTEKKDRLLVYQDQSGAQKTVRASTLNAKLVKSLLADPTTKQRDIIAHQVEWYKIAGSKIIDQRDWPGRYIPIARVPGEETFINGELDRKGHTRALKDPQRVYNYNVSSAMEHVALQGKSPWVAPVAAIENLETYYESANRVNHAVMPYNAYDDQNRPIPAPERAQPPVMSQAYVQAMQIAAEDMQLVSGQYQAEMGAPSNERSGVAIQQRQRQGDNATYHYIDNFSMAVRFLGKIIIDLVPKIYDTPRVIKILGEDGSEQQVTIDPQAKQALAKKQSSDRDAVQQVLFNPNVGKYEVQADIGPAFSTRRQEAFNAYSQIIASNKDLVSLIGDLMFLNADFPGADEIAERLKRMVPPQATGDGPPPAVMQAQQQLQASQSMIAKLTDELAKLKLELKGKDQLRGVEEYDAVTKRIAALAKQFLTPKEAAQMVHDLVVEEHRTSLIPDVSATDMDLASAAQPQPQSQPQAQPQAA